MANCMQMTRGTDISPIFTVSGPGDGLATQLAAGLTRPLSPGEAAAAAPTAVATATEACTAEQTCNVNANPCGKSTLVPSKNGIGGEHGKLTWAQSYQCCE